MVLERWKSKLDLIAMNLKKLTMPVDGSADLDSVSTAMTCVDLSFQGQYFRQLAVETSSHE